MQRSIIFENIAKQNTEEMENTKILLLIVKASNLQGMRSRHVGSVMVDSVKGNSKQFN